MQASLREQLHHELQQLEKLDRLRVPPRLAGLSRVSPIVAGTPAVSFASNDYLGLASDPRVLAALTAAAHATGAGASGSRLITGDLPEHRSLEHCIAGLVGLPAALVFPTGYQANLGLITALVGPGDVVVSDSANHASIIDGCRLSRAEIAIYPHRNAAAAAAALSASHPSRRRLLLTESLFSMDGDVAPLADLAEIAGRYDAALIVDEAHALGTLGPSGAGLCRDAGIVPDALVGTLGKAFGAAGGFVAGSPELIQYLVNRARTFIFTTALPPGIAAAARTAIDLAQSPAGDVLRARLQDRIAQTCAGLGRPPVHGPIVPVILGSDSAALGASQSLASAGLFVQAIRPPTVAEGTARLRVTLSSAHTPQMVDRLTSALTHLLPRPPA